MFILETEKYNLSMWVNLVGNNFTELHQNYICKTQGKKKKNKKVWFADLLHVIHSFEQLAKKHHVVRLAKDSLMALFTSDIFS